MKCPRCEQENPPQAKFCLECAAPLARRCAGCGTQLPAAAKFCFECATPVSGAPPRFASPETYTPKHLAERIISSRAALEGERKQVTVLFADLKGSMELLADRDPEEARKLLDPVLELMMEAVHRYEGTVNQVMGDGIMALLGAPVAHEDHAVRACYAALRMQETVRRYAEDARRAHGVEVQIRIGLNSGEVVVRSVGSDLRMDYTAVGQTTHLAARMEQLAPPGAVRMTGETVRLAEGYVEVRSLGPIPVKGLSDPIEVFELTGVGQARTRLQAATARGLTRFVGRDAEIDQLRRALEEAGTGQGQLVAAVGEPGVGKSRLFHEFTHSHRVQDWLILQSGSVSYGKATSYLPVVDLLKAYFKVDDRAAHRDIREKVTGKLLTLDRALEPALPALLALLDVLVEDAQWQALDPPQRRQRTLDAVKRLLLRESQEQPLLVIFEDLHWIDAETQGFLDSLVESLPTARLLVLVNYRPEYRHGWSSKSYYTQLRLDALARESAGALLLALLGADATVEPLRPVLIARTGGNPLFLEESVRTLVETNALTGERGAYQLTRPLDTIDVPATVQAILASRIDRLAPADKQLLQTASVIGKDVPFPLLEAIAELPDEDLRRGLGRLQAAEFLYETSLFPELEYTFKHALTHEVAYGTLLHEHRRALHARIVEAVERLYRERLVEHTERLAHHAVRGEAWSKAVTYGRQAATRAGDRSAMGEQGAYIEQALGALKHLPPDPEVLERIVDLRLMRHSSLFALGEPEQLVHWLAETLPLSEALGDPYRLAKTTAQMANALWFTGQNLRALEASRSALVMAERLGAPDVEIRTRMDIGQISRSTGDYREGIAVLEPAVQLVQGDLGRQRLNAAIYPFVTVHSTLANCLAALGEFDRASAAATEAVRFAELKRHPGSVMMACGASGYTLLTRGAYLQAIAWLERSVEISRQPGLASFYATVGARLGLAYAYAGRPDDAFTALHEALDRAQRRARMAEATAMLCLGEALVLTGHLDDARALVLRAMDLARGRSERGMEARSLWLLGEIGARSPAHERQDAVNRYQEATALGAERGMLPLVAACHLGLGTLYRRTDKPEQAQAHLTTATTMYRGMGMTYWLERAESELT
jgi:class 3 adenylate cyclase/tetratricopeptide (TPR) repeat protein